LILNGVEYPIEKRIGLDILDIVQDEYKSAFNEYVISTSKNDGIIEYKLYIGDMYAGTHKATSLIISVPNGSTAYSLSAGGGLLLPNMEVFQIIPLAPLSMTSRPIITPSNIPIKLIITNTSHHSISVRADGQQIVSKPGPLNFKFTQSANKVSMLHNTDWNFFEMLSTKLGWKNA